MKYDRKPGERLKPIRHLTLWSEKDHVFVMGEDGRTGLWYIDRRSRGKYVIVRSRYGSAGEKLTNFLTTLAVNQKIHVTSNKPEFKTQFKNVICEHDYVTYEFEIQETL